MGNPSWRSRSVRLISGTALVVLVVIAVGVRGDLPGTADHSAIVAAAGRHRFNLAVWELKHLLEVNSGRISADAQTVDRYFELAEVRRIQNLRVLRVLAQTGSAETAESVAARRTRERIAQEMEALEPAVIAALRVAVSDTLADAALTTDFPGLGHRLFPPVAFALEELPWVLVVSRRDRIELLETVVLRPDTPIETMESIEKALERRGLSALVDRIGGLATYPSLVREDLHFRQAIATVAHEWVHHYAFFRPLGQRYQAGSVMTTVNETFANIVGDEIAAQFFEEQPPSFTALFDLPQPERPAAQFDAGQYLRETRERTDSLLAMGFIDEAEAFMEARRTELVTQGVYLRKLNQAFFAFRGTYADSPASVSPVFEQLTTLRRASDSLREFVDAVVGIRTPDDVTRLLEERT